MGFLLLVLLESDWLIVCTLHSLPDITTWLLFEVSQIDVSLIVVDFDQLMHLH